MKKIVYLLLMIVLFSLCLSGCCLFGHEWLEPTCTEPKTCSKCGKTEGEALGHHWQEATCTMPKTCKLCGEKQGEPVHDWEEATEDAPKTCKLCGLTEGLSLQDQRSVDTIYELLPGNWKPCRAFSLYNGYIKEGVKFSDLRWNELYCASEPLYGKFYDNSLVNYFITGALVVDTNGMINSSLIFVKENLSFNSSEWEFSKNSEGSTIYYELAIHDGDNSYYLIVDYMNDTGEIAFLNSSRDRVIILAKN